MKMQKNNSIPSHIEMIGGNIDSTEKELYDLGIKARKHDKISGADMAHSMARDYPTAIVYIGMMMDENGNPVKEAQKSYKDLMSLPEEQRMIAIKFFIDGYSKAE
jgi:hypothetical protein